MNIPNRPKLTISFIMTALNEESNIWGAINDTLKALDYFKVTGEIIAIDDGSSDKTGSIITDLMNQESRIRMLRHDKPEGVGASFWHGVDNATGDVVCWIPGDNENDPWEILRYFDLLRHVDVVIPFVFNKQTRSLFRNMLSFIYRFIINTTFGVNFNYTNGTVLYRKSILDKLAHRSSSFFFQTDMLVRIVKRGYLFAEVPYRLGSRSSGSSKAVTFPSLLKVVKGYLQLAKDIYYAKEGLDKEGFIKGTKTSSRHTDTKPRL